MLIIIYGLLFLSIKKDFFSPTMLMLYGYGISVLFCLLNYSHWNYVFNGYTTFCIFSGVFIFGTVELITSRLSLKTMFQTTEESKPEFINISSVTYIILLVVQLFGLAMLFREVIQIGGGLTASFAQLMFSFKQTQLDTNVDFSGFVSMLTKITSAISALFLYVFINNHYYRKRVNKVHRKSFHYLIPVISGLVQSLLKGNRLLFLSYPVFAVVCYYLIAYRFERKQYKINIKQIIKLLFAFALVLSLFFNIRELAGRRSDSDFFAYISTYAGSSIVNFNNYLLSGKREHWTSLYEFVPGLINSLYKIGLMPDSASKVLEYSVYSSTGAISNVYTGLRRMYNWQGYMGIVVGQILYSMLFSGLYKNLKNNHNSNKFFGLKTIIYCRMVYCLVLQSVEDQFFMTDISIGYVIDTLILIVIYYFAIYKRITFGRME